MNKMIKIAVLTICTLIALPSKADPVVALASLILAQKISQPQHKAQHRNTTGWQELLALKEKQALTRIQAHPAISACMKRAAQKHPVATYHLRKIARFSAMIHEQSKNGRMPALAKTKYRWPAKGFQWCKQQAGITTASGKASLEKSARQLASLSNGYANEIMVAMAH